MPLLESRVGKIWNLAVHSAENKDPSLLVNITLDEIERTLAIFGNKVDRKAPAYKALESRRDALRAAQSYAKEPDGKDAA